MRRNDDEIEANRLQFKTKRDDRIPTSRKAVRMTSYIPLTVAGERFAAVRASQVEIVMVDEHERHIIREINGRVRQLEEHESLHSSETEALAAGAGSLRSIAATALAKAAEIEAGLASTKPEVIS